jgi:FKBP-type peptidyl-prolyl cis-trans isomerase SlyD
MTPTTIQDGVVVTIRYSLEVDGAPVPLEETSEPMDYLHGADNIVPGLEEALNGKKVGDRLSVTVTPENGYGAYDPDDVDEVPREEVAHLTDLEEGMVIEVEDDDGDVYLAFVREIGADTVTLDFNPPLAGKTLTYHVEVAALREATAEELDHGHVHGDDWDDEEWDDDSN